MCRRLSCIIAVSVLPAIALPGVAAASHSTVRTVGQFDRLSFRARERFAVTYMTTHPDNVCYHGHPTPRKVAVNVEAAMAGISPSDGSSDPHFTASEPIGKAIRQAEGAIGC